MFSKYIPKAGSAHTHTHTHTLTHQLYRKGKGGIGAKAKERERERERRQLCCQIAAFSLKWRGLGLTDADIKDTLATYFKTKERWIYKAG